MNRIAVLWIILICANSLYGQVHAFTDIRNRLMKYADGKTALVEQQQFFEVRGNGNYLTYITNTAELAVVTPTHKSTFGTAVTNYLLTNHMIAWWDGRFVYFLDPDAKRPVSYAPYAPFNQAGLFVAPHAVGDSLIAFVDRNNEIILLENGRSKTLTLLGSNFNEPDEIDLSWNAWFQRPPGSIPPAPETRFSDVILIAGDNILGYTDINGFFRCYYKGRDGKLDEFKPMMAAAGSNTLAWVDPRGEFKALWKGKPFRIDFLSTDAQTVNQASIRVGDDLIAWIRQDGALMAFYAGEQEVVELAGVERFTVIDQLLIYTAIDKSFNVYHKGKSHRLQQIEPERFEAWGDRLVFMNRINQLAGFWNGKSELVYDEVVQDFTLYGPLVRVTLAPFQFEFID